jgi:hypothetical protein
LQYDLCEPVRFSRVKAILKRFSKRKPVLLPPELWQAIFEDLSLQDVLAVRLNLSAIYAGWGLPLSTCRVVDIRRYLTSGSAMLYKLESHLDMP